VRTTNEQRRTTNVFLDSAIVFVLTCVLIFPLFRLKYLDNWGSIESTFIADARMLRENLPHPGWQPLWYCGTRFDYIYPPALRYGTALTSLAFHLTTARAYHLYVGVLYALGIAGVYWLAYVGSRSRAQAWLASALTSLLSPALLLMPDYHRDSPDWVPQRLHVLMSYGEGPHISAVSVLGLALAASFVALRRWNPLAFAASGALCAAVVAHNFYGATALAIFFPILTWAVFLEVRQPHVWFRAAGIVAVSYGLCAFWLTPSYIRITTLNLRWVASPSTPWSGTIAFACVLTFYVVTYLAAKQAKAAAWPMFLIGSAVFISIYVLGAHYGFIFAGNGLRLAPELDLVLLLLGAWCLSSAWKRPLLRIGVIVLLCAACYPAQRYVRRAWTIFPRAGAIESRCEFDITKWMNDHMPGVRALSTGSIRFWYDAWFNDAEAYGGSDQGMLNQNIVLAHWQITQGTSPDQAIPWLQALGADALIVPDRTSPEIYHDYAHPEIFHGALPALYDDHRGTVIYRVPRRFPALARVVEKVSLAPLTPDMLNRYVAAIEQGPDSAVSLKRLGFDAVDLTATTSPGQAVLFQETFDPAWHAYAGGLSLRIDRDPMGFMLIAAPAGAHTIHMRFETPLENRIGWILTGITCVSLLALLWPRAWLRRSRSPTTAC